jgi:hypothetical protein
MSNSLKKSYIFLTMVIRFIFIIYVYFKIKSKIFPNPKHMNLIQLGLVSEKRINYLLFIIIESVISDAEK